jgi:hypothetical protein
MVELPAWAVVLPHVGLGADPGGQEAGAVLLTLPVQRVPLLGLQGHRHTARHNHHLGTGNGQHIRNRDSRKLYSYYKDIKKI